MSKVISIIAFFLPVALLAQGEVIELINPSFEETPHRGISPYDIGIRGWYDCGALQFPTETPPDIHPVNAWQVTKPPLDGKTYLGMVVRDNDSWESVSQRINTPLETGKCYEFNLQMARSRFYISGSKLRGTMANYTEPAVLRIWGGTGVCGRQELLAESETVTNADWRLYDFRLEPGRSLNYFTIEAFYDTPVLMPYNGHLLIDGASAITEVPCKGEDLLAAVEKTDIIEEAIIIYNKEPEKINPGGVESVQEAIEDKPVETESKERKPKLIAELDGKTVKKGQVIRINNIYFAADSSRIRDESFDVIDEIYVFLKENENIVVEIGGHTSTMPSHDYCDNLSTMRAKEVATALVRKGISPKRLSFKGYGKRKPIIRNDKFDMEARKKNQRVEIKILSV